MRKLVSVVEVEEGLDTFLGEKVLVMCNNYHYSGTLSGVNDIFIKLDNCSIVYETGAWTDSKFKDSQSLGAEPHYIMIGHIEGFRLDPRS